MIWLKGAEELLNGPRVRDCFVKNKLRSGDNVNITVFLQTTWNKLQNSRGLWVQQRSSSSVKKKKKWKQKGKKKQMRKTQTRQRGGALTGDQANSGKSLFLEDVLYYWQSLWLRSASECVSSNSKAGLNTVQTSDTVFDKSPPPPENQPTSQPCMGNHTHTHTHTLDGRLIKV